MIYKILAVLIATSSGSLHCGAMCGGLSVSVGSGLLLQSCYQGARLISYLLMGFISGWVGAEFFDSESLEGIAIFSGVVLSGWLVASGLHLFFKGRPLEWSRAGVFPFRIFSAYPLLATPGMIRAAVFGALTPLLPCGWLMTAFVLSVNSGSQWVGAAIFGAVWAGSLPVLLLGQSIFRMGAGWFQTGGRRWVALVMIFAGIVSVYQRLNQGSVHAPGLTEPSVCHDIGNQTEIKND
jgi:sulfite exporter TauE/SafE